MKEQESNPYSVQLNQKLAATAEALRKAEDRLRNPDRLHIANEELIAIDAIQLAGLYEQLKGTRDKTAREEIMRNIKDYIAKASEGKIHQDFPNNAS